MMYHNKFVASIKTNGKVLRESNGEVAVPFGSEYSILLKNMNSVKAQVRVSIDGEEATSGWIIIQPNGKLDLERWIKNNNLSKGNKFKFIERTTNIENHRGIGIEDGIVKITYKFEKRFEPTQKIIHEHHYNPWYPYYPWNQPVIINVTDPSQTDWSIYNGNLQGGQTAYTTTSGSLYDAHCNTFGSAGMNVMNTPIGSSSGSRSLSASLSKCADIPTQQNMMMAVSMPENKAGITVPGSESNQTFYNVSDFACEASEVIVLKLVGAFGGTKVTKPITVDVKPKCSTCGRINKATNKFCAECGTSLVLIG